MKISDLAAIKWVLVRLIKSLIFRNSKWVWSGNTTITNCSQPRVAARKSRSTIMRQQEDFSIEERLLWEITMWKESIRTAFYHLSLTYLINSIIQEHPFKIFYVDCSFTIFPRGIQKSKCRRIILTKMSGNVYKAVCWCKTFSPWQFNGISHIPMLWKSISATTMSPEPSLLVIGISSKHILPRCHPTICVSIRMVLFLKARGRARISGKGVHMHKVWEFALLIYLTFLKYHMKR